ncbi:hypothetical protein FBUS_05474 [Fasciolopsis buskii]|uniref:Uncharacterized protein n=1 Tax=Fasciolopsis buskii TaxID=27845 RepID=A0A8E0VMI1_9TREM|nr:hypothetical protein FBUS_05474 [Fasciolopsis buski]
MLFSLAVRFECNFLNFLLVFFSCTRAQLIDSGRFNQTLEFPLADQFSRFVLRATFVYLPTRANEPSVLIETKAEQSLHHSQVLCVESIKCPEPTTTTAVTTTTMTTNIPATIALVTIEDSTSGTSSSQIQISGEISGVGGPKDSISRHTSDPFWDTLLSGTEPKSWFLATVSLASLCLLLLIILLITWLYVCRLKRLHARRRCRGTCRFGCRCTSDVIRQTVTDAAVCGPLDSQNHHLFASPMTPQGNGSLRSGSGFGAALYPGGTMTSSRWGSNGVHKVGAPLYVSLANASDKTALLAANYPNSGCIIQTGVNPSPGPVVPMANSIDNMSGTWSQLNGQRSSSHVPRRRLSQDALHRSTSDGSSVSGHAVHGSNNCPAPKGSVQGRGGVGVSYIGGPVASMPGTVLIANGNSAVAPQSPDASGSVYYHQQPGGIIAGSGGGADGSGSRAGTGGTAYSYTDSGRDSGVSPGLSQSPTRLNGRKMNDRGYYIPHGSLGPSSRTGTVNEEEEEPQANADPRYFTNSLHPNAYATRGSEGDLLNITPPSGFYDPNGSGGTDSGLVNGSSSSGRSNTHVTANSFGQRAFLGPLYPILGSPVGRAANEWSGISLTGGDLSGMVSVSNANAGTLNGPGDQIQQQQQQQQQHQQQHMVGAMDPEHVSSISHGASACSDATNDPYASAKPMISPRLYTASERML